ncbi:DUF2568 domain-containing protein [Peribacillus cavernae]|uniref:DUF2568 domain-containing protein n=1 Tax=Peribacillus cavernae TaxID=1674310 RepID=A0A3S0W4Z7_9BACI|nr:YrdB family protein [Peribacillus cavernae]MDQ0219281.1 hypothetical protein [Peribacillus cavernae]RUQ27831.1 DUF2568 domain-containing protein [Peribacillus cavernae]
MEQKVSFKIATLLAIGFWGFQKGSGIISSVLLGIGGPLLIAIIWGMFIAPKSLVILPFWAQLGLEAGIFGVAFIVLMNMGFSRIAYIIGLIVIINRILMIIWKQ